MTDLASPRPAQPSQRRGRVRLRTLVLIRWIGVAGQAAALLIVASASASTADGLGEGGGRGLLHRQHLPPACRRGSTWLDDTKAALQLAYDLLQLAVLLYLTGGLHNPFAILILAPVIVSATVLSRAAPSASPCWRWRRRGAVAFHLPLPWPIAAFACSRCSSPGWRWRSGCRCCSSPSTS